MPRKYKSGVDWVSIRERYEAGESAYSIARSTEGTPSQVRKQSILQRIDKEGWRQAGEAEPGRQLSDSDLFAPILEELDSCWNATPERLRAIRDNLREGTTDAVTAALVGISRDTLRDWRKRSPLFAAMCANAQAEDAKRHIGHIRQAAERGDWKAAERLLAANPISREEYAKDATSGGASIQVVLNIPRTMEDAARIIEAAPVNRLSED